MRRTFFELEKLTDENVGFSEILNFLGFSERRIFKNPSFMNKHVPKLSDNRRFTRTLHENVTVRFPGTKYEIK